MSSPLTLPLKIFIGCDSKEPAAFSVLAHSILSRATIPVSIVPLTLAAARWSGFTRTRGALEATEFSFTRFLVPHLCNFEGMAVFMDCDMLCRVDLLELLIPMLAYPDAGALVCPHDYVPKAATKFLGQTQTTYPRKNWSSFIVFNNAECRALTLDYVNTASGLELHRFHWLDERKIGHLDLAWNWLVGEYAPNPNAKILHYTLGTPCFAEYRDCDHADVWWADYDAMRAPIVERAVVAGAA
jgi:hypothetical protein